jgi:hypothetical protein
MREWAFLLLCACVFRIKNGFDRVIISALKIMAIFRGMHAPPLVKKMTDNAVINDR